MYTGSIFLTLYFILFAAAELLGVIPEEMAAALISNVNYLRGAYISIHTETNYNFEILLVKLLQKLRFAYVVTTISTLSCKFICFVYSGENHEFKEH